MNTMTSIIERVAGLRPVSAADATSVLNAVQDLDYQAQLTKADDGRALIHVTAQDIVSTIEFDGAEADAASGLTFTVCFEQAATDDLATLNGWNQTHRIGVAFQNENGDPCLSHSIAVVEDMPRAQFAVSFEMWIDAISAFYDLLD